SWVSATSAGAPPSHSRPFPLSRTIGARLFLPLVPSFAEPHRLPFTVSCSKRRRRAKVPSRGTYWLLESCLPGPCIRPKEGLHVCRRAGHGPFTIPAPLRPRGYRKSEERGRLCGVDPRGHPGRPYHLFPDPAAPRCPL